MLGLGASASAAQTTTKPRPKTTAASKPTLANKAADARRRVVAKSTTPTPAPTESAGAAVPRYKVDASGELVPDVKAAAAIIFNPVTNQVLWEENSQDQRSIASITKVMTATVFLERDPDLTEPVTITRSDVFQASTTKLRLNDKVTTDDLLHLLLIASDNAAARALARVSPLGSEGFIERMNQKAVELGLTTTHYADPSGLLADNVSSAYDMAKLIAMASSDDRIGSIMRLPEYTVQAARRIISFRTTDRLLGRPDVDIRAAKTGFISKSGYCLATLLRLPQGNQEVAVVVLGARSNAGRFVETENLFTWLSSKASTLFATTEVVSTGGQQQ